MTQAPDSNRNSIDETTDKESTGHTRRTVLKSLGGGLCFIALAREASQIAERNVNTRRGPEATVVEEGDPFPDIDEPHSELEFPDQRFNSEGSAVKVDRIASNSEFYISIHNYSRFEPAEGVDIDELRIPEPAERRFPVCDSLIGITELFPPGEYENVEVPLYTADAPAVQLDVSEEGATLDRTQPLVAIPHLNTTGEEFTCPDDPRTPDVREEPDEVDGAFSSGTKDTDTIPVVHDLALMVRSRDEGSEKAIGKLKEEHIRKGNLVPQPIGEPLGEDEVLDRDIEGLDQATGGDEAQEENEKVEQEEEEKAAEVEEELEREAEAEGKSDVEEAVAEAENDSDSHEH